MALPRLYQRKAPRTDEEVFTQWGSDAMLWSAGQVAYFMGVSKRSARRLVARLLMQGQIVRYR